MIHSQVHVLVDPVLFMIFLRTKVVHSTMPLHDLRKVKEPIDKISLRLHAAQAQRLQVSR
jgi:hypothetical protein